MELELIVELGDSITTITCEEQVLCLTNVSKILSHSELNLARCTFNGNVIY